MLPASGTGILNADNPGAAAAADSVVPDRDVRARSRCDVRGSPQLQRSTGIGSRAAPTSTWSAADWWAPSGSRARSGPTAVTPRSRRLASRRVGDPFEEALVPPLLRSRRRAGCSAGRAPRSLIIDDTYNSSPAAAIEHPGRACDSGAAEPIRRDHRSAWAHHRNSDPPREASTRSSWTPSAKLSSVSMVFSPSATRLGTRRARPEKPGCPPSGCWKSAGPDEAIRALMECAEPGSVVLWSRRDRSRPGVGAGGKRDDGRGAKGECADSGDGGLDGTPISAEASGREKQEQQDDLRAAVRTAR